MKKSPAKVEREYGPFPGAKNVGGVSFDGKHVWAALGDRLNAFDPATGEVQRSLSISAHAGTAFDGKHLYQIAERQIQKLDPQTGKVLATIPAPGNGGDSGLAWAEGSLWVGEHRARKIHRLLPQPFVVAQQVTGMEGPLVKLDDSIRSLEDLLDGNYDHNAEQDFSHTDGIEDVLAAHEKRSKEG